MYLRGHGTLGSSGPAEPPASSDVVVERDSLRAVFAGLTIVFSFFSPGVVGTAVEVAVFPQSKAVPGVLGVLLADPNEANAPEPRPNADDPPVVGELRPLPVKGEMALNGLVRPP